MQQYGSGSQNSPPPLPPRPGQTSQTPQSSVNPNGNQGLNVWQLYLQTLANNPNPSRAAPSSSPSINPTTNPFAQPQGGQPNIHPHYSSSNAGNYPNPAPNPTPYDAYPGSYSQRPSSNPNPQSYPYANTNPNWNPYPNSNSNGNPYPPGTFARNQPSNPNQTDPLTQLVNQMAQQQLEEQQKVINMFDQQKPNPAGFAFLQNLVGLGQKIILTLTFSETPPTFNVTITREQKQFFIDQGYLHIPDVVPKTLIDRALRAINRNLAIPPSQQKLQVLRSVTSCPDLIASKVIMDLLTHSPALAYIEAMLGKINFPRHGQIALRYPGDGCLLGNIDKFTAPGMVDAIAQGNPLIGGVMNQLLGTDDEDRYYVIGPNWHEHWHIDGFPQSVTGIKSGEVKNFTMLIGILLADAPDEYMGNLTVYPGGHHLLERFFRDQGGVLKMMNQTTFEGIKYVVDACQPHMPKPVQLRGKAGDIFLLHYQLPHSIAPNISPHIRYACYFRIHHARHALETPKPDVMTDIWCDFDGLRDLTQHLRERK